MCAAPTPLADSAKAALLCEAKKSSTRTVCLCDFRFAVEVHPAGGFRRGFGGNVLSAPRASGGFEVFGEGASSFLGLNGGGALRRGPAELRADVELEEFLLLQRLQQAGVGEGLQAELQRHLEAQLRHPLPGLGGGGASFSGGFFSFFCLFVVSTFHSGAPLPKRHCEGTAEQREAGAAGWRVRAACRGLRV